MRSILTKLLDFPVGLSNQLFITMFLDGQMSTANQGEGKKRRDLLKSRAPNTCEVMDEVKHFVGILGPSIPSKTKCPGF